MISFLNTNSKNLWDNTNNCCREKSTLDEKKLSTFFCHLRSWGHFGIALEQRRNSIKRNRTKKIQSSWCARNHSHNHQHQLICFIDVLHTCVGRLAMIINDVLFYSGMSLLSENNKGWSTNIVIITVIWYIPAHRHHHQHHHCHQ